MYIKENNVAIRKFDMSDVDLKVKWINDEKNNKYLHYALPLYADKTAEWWEKTKDADGRLDLTILYNDEPVGLIGLLGIDKVNKKAEYYVCLGEHSCKGKGVAKAASRLLVKYAFEVLDLNKVYLYTEEENIPAQRLFESLGFRKEGLLIDDLIYNGRKVNRFVYGLLKDVADI